ncbi:hypothetical protein K3495_g15843, partial [Podosphaera aphanis]
MLSDRGPQFISEFWVEFNKILGTKIKLGSVDHPQTDGQTEIYNQYLQKRLRPFVNFYQSNWSELLPMMDYAQLTLPHDSLGGISPFEVVHGYAPRTSWDWKSHDYSATSINKENAQAITKNLHQAWDLATKHLQQAQKVMADKTNVHRREIDFQVGDEVWLDMRYYKSQRPSKKLDFPTNGKFKIIEKVGNAFRLRLPPSMAINNTFPPDKLRKAANDPLPGQEQPASFPININGYDEHEIDEILACKLTNRILSYRVAWLNEDADLNW